MGKVLSAVFLQLDCFIKVLDRFGKVAHLETGQAPVMESVSKLRVNPQCFRKIDNRCVVFLLCIQHNPAPIPNCRVVLVQLDGFIQLGERRDVIALFVLNHPQRSDRIVIANILLDPLLVKLPGGGNRHHVLPGHPTPDPL